MRRLRTKCFSTGDYISPRLCGLLWFEKPVLLYWLAAGAYHLFGVNEFSARLPSALAALGTIGFSCYACWRSGWRRLGIAVAIVLATSIIWIGFGHAASTDMLLSASVSIAVLAAFISTVTQGKAQLKFLMLSAAATGTAMLAKGLIGVLLVALILGIHSIVTRRFLFQRRADLGWAILIFTVVISLWYVPVMLKHGNLFVEEFFINHHFKRYLTNKYQHPQPVYFYLFIAFAGALPWAFFALPAMQRLLLLQPRLSQRDSLLALAWIWFFVPVVFFSFSTSKLPGYILPAFPALAFILGAEVERLWHGEQSRLLNITAILNSLSFALLGGIAVNYLHKKGFLLQNSEMVIYSVPLVFAVAAAFVASRDKTHLTTFGPALTVLMLLCIATFRLFPQANSFIGLKPYSMNVASLLKPDEDILFYRREKQYSHTFYSNGRVAFYNEGRIIKDISSGDDLDIENREELVSALKHELTEGEPSVVLVTINTWQNELKSDGRFKTQIVAQDGKETAIRVWLIT